ncbi:hypothetical protein [Streptomyces sp. NRRL S-87]|uniref:hypothetical protein n=1 Tax=Streptomyces sp. NRRL S-87 TaxID=1463920 RepID=UPI0004BFA65B|nr:hypothetical protein [Streptomyces sp. NRRL S-87]
MSASEPQNRAQGYGPALVAALLALGLGVGMTVFDGAARTALAVGLGLAVLVSAGLVGASVRRSRGQ